ncbi:MAG: hypothetical protein ACREDM_12485 [Methylocella sp.]
MNSIACGAVPGGKAFDANKMRELGGQDDAEEMGLDTAAGLPKTRAVRSTPRVWNNRNLGLAFFKQTQYPRKSMFSSQCKML